MVWMRGGSCWLIWMMLTDWEDADRRNRMEWDTGRIENGQRDRFLEAQLIDL